MTKKLLLSLCSLALVANAAMAGFPNATVKGMERNYRPVFEKTEATKMQRAAQADDTQLYLCDFEEADENTGAPIDWITIDDFKDENGLPAIFCVPVYQASQGLMEAFSGEIALASMYDSNAARNAWAIAPGVELTAGVTYHFGIYSLCQGYMSNLDEWEMTIGTAQTPEAQTTVIIDRTGSNAVADTDWTLCQGTFTPETTGTYYPAIHHCTTALDVNMCLWDFFQIDSDHIRIYPEGYLYSIGGLWNMDQFFADENGYRLIPTTYLPDNSPLQYGYVGENVESVSWDFGFYGTADDTEAASPLVTYSLAEEDSVLDETYLIMMNRDGEEYAYRTFNIKKTDSEMGYFDVVSNIKPEDGLFAPSISEEDPYSAVVGLSNFWKKTAERFVRPVDGTTALHGVAPMYAAYKMSIVNKSKEFTVRVLKADENRMPGEEIYSQNFKFSDYFKANDGGLMISQLPFPEPVFVTGTFFIELEMPEDITVSSNNIFMIPIAARNYNDNSLFMYDATQEKWVASNDMLEDLGGISSTIFIAGEFAEFAGVDKVIANNYQIFFDGENIIVAGVNAGDAITVNDIAGRTVANVVANDVKTVIDTELNAGIYLVTINGQTQKIAVR